MTYRDSEKEDRSHLVITLGANVAGINPSTGAVVWSHTFKSSRLRVKVHKGVIYVLVSNAHQVVGLDYPTGKQIFDTKFPGTYYGTSTMIIEGERIFVAMGGEVSALNLGGDFLWTNSLPGWGTGVSTLAFPDNEEQGDH